MAAFMDVVFFIFRYIPFWSIPIMMILVQFGYVYWVKEVRWVAMVFYSCAAVCALFLIYYLYAGSPDNSARMLDEFIRSI